MKRKCPKCNDIGIVKSSIRIDTDGRTWDYLCDCKIGKEWGLEMKKTCSCYDGSGIICKEHFYGKAESKCARCGECKAVEGQEWYICHKCADELWGKTEPKCPEGLCEICDAEPKPKAVSVEPSDAEQAEWSDVTKEYVRSLEAALSAVKPVSVEEIEKIITEHIKNVPIAGDFDRTRAIYANEAVIRKLATAIAERLNQK